MVYNINFYSFKIYTHSLLKAHQSHLLHLNIYVMSVFRWKETNNGEEMKFKSYLK